MIVNAVSTAQQTRSAATCLQLALVGRLSNGDGVRSDAAFPLDRAGGHPNDDHGLHVRRRDAQQLANVVLEQRSSVLVPTQRTRRLQAQSERPPRTVGDGRNSATADCLRLVGGDEQESHRVRVQHLLFDAF